jgi:hypothetical protein
VLKTLSILNAAVKAGTLTVSDFTLLVEIIARHEFDIRYIIFFNTYVQPVTSFIPSIGTIATFATSVVAIMQLLEFLSR